VRVLVACEFSGTVRDAFRALGHDAVSCDLLPSEKPGPHVCGDVRDVLYDGWDLMVAHPPCTYLSRAGARWWRDPERMRKAGEAYAFVRELYDAPIGRVAIENPIGLMNRMWRYPDQTIQPWQFGDPYTKATCLWLRGLPQLTATHARGEPQAWVRSNTGHGRRKGQRSQPGIAKNAKDAARTFPGIAAAMAAQWGHV
jgi:site-specific DNA-cytosine methylase